jgi:crossover junction endodeoxyribonuclease RuvC
VKLLAIDPGLTGAFAVLGPDGKLIEIIDMPTLADGPKGRPAVNAGLCADLIYRLSVSRAVVEQVGVMPREGAVGAFAFGKSVGILLGALAAAGVPVEMVTPQAWKRALGLSGDKDASRSMAIRQWPAQAGLFSRKKDDGRADAALIGLAAIKQKNLT